MRYIANPAIGDLWDFITDKNCAKQDCTTQYIPVRDGRDWTAEEYNGGGGGGSTTLSGLEDVSITTASNGQTIIYSNGKWKNSTIDMIDTLEELKDVSISGIENGDTIVYNSTTHKFENKALGSIYKVKGSVIDFEHLPTTGNEVGDVWNVLDTGANYVWNGTERDKLSETVDVDALTVQVETLPLATTENEGRIYQYVGDTTTDYTKGMFYVNNNGTWEVIQTSSSDAELSENITSNVAVGGIEVGTTFTAGTSLESIVRQMLVKYFAPTIALTINPSTSPVISGTTIASVTMSAVATKKTDDITSISFYANNTLVHEETTGVASGGTFTYTYTPTNPIDDDITFKVTVSDGTSDVDATKKIDFVSGSYFGQVADTVTNPTASDITALTQLALAAKGYTANNISMTYGKLLYAYPASYGDLTSIKDANNFEYITSYTKSTVTIDGVSYNCYLLTDATGVTGFKQIYA